MARAHVALSLASTMALLAACGPVPRELEHPRPALDLPQLHGEWFVVIFFRANPG